MPTNCVSVWRPFWAVDLFSNHILRGAMEKSGVERRKHKRYKVDDVVFVLWRADHENGMGRIIDISESGLGCHCLGRNHNPMDYPELEIVLSEDNYHLVTLPSRPVSDLEIGEKLPFNLKKRRCGLQFNRLSANQRFRLQYFIRTRTREGAQL
jgi:hypothetical protein